MRVIYVKWQIKEWLEALRKHPYDEGITGRE